MIAGVTTGYEKKLNPRRSRIQISSSRKHFDLALGFSHPVKLEIPTGLTVTAEKNLITISGIDKEQVGQFSAYTIT
jgi:large subunit ribosomal protein L6